MVADEQLDTSKPPLDEIEHRFFLLGNGEGRFQIKSAFETFVKENKAAETSVLFLGDNISGNNSETVKKQLHDYISVIKNTGATPYFVPGKQEWDFNGTEGLETIEDYLEEYLEKDDVLTPNNGCPLESIEIGDSIQLIVIDTQWYLEDWDRHPKMNDKCEIKTREKLLLEVRGELKKSANKTILVAMHHPMLTNGYHGGRFSFRDHIFPFQNNIPLPGVGSLIAQIRSQGAISMQDRYNTRYNELMGKLQEQFDVSDKRIVLFSAHEQNLQYIEDGFVKQLISGAASETRPASISDNGLFSYGNNGFAQVDVYKSGAVWTTFYSANGEKIAQKFDTEIFPEIIPPVLDTLPKTFPKTYTASVYDIEKVKRSDFFQTFWGKHYRDVYGIPVEAPTAVLDTLYGGLEVVRPGGGHQTKSLRLVTKDGKEYNMRALKKSAVQFLNKNSPNNIDGEKYYGNTLPADLITDFYTAAHPYGAFAIPAMARAAQVYYTTPQLYYVPQQRALGKYNEEYGNQLYMIVERPAEEYKNRKSFGYPDNVESTDDLLQKLREDEDHVLDEHAYIRARIFDMLIGDWDRHSDQWRWAEFENEEGHLVFVPIPRDRDQVFANFDGTFLNIIRDLVGTANQFGVYGPDIKDVKWFNTAGSHLDRALVKRSNRNDWLAEARRIQAAITEQTVQQAFASLPEAVQDTTLQTIKEHLLARKENLVDIVGRYYDWLDDFQMLTGTDKDDHFEIIRKPNGVTQIIAYRIKDGEKADILFDRTFRKEETNEIWLYGLDDDDIFTVTGKSKNPILVRIIGGQDEDTYDVAYGKNIKIYDRRSAENEIVQKSGAQVRLTNFYESNRYNYEMEPSNSGGISLAVGYNPDQGTVLTAGYSSEKVEFIANPYSRLTQLQLQYHSLTQGLDIRLKKGYAAIFGDVNFILDARYTSKNYTENFFGFGNESNNFEEEVSFDFNRVNLSRYEGGIGLERSNPYGSFLQFKLDLETVEIVRNGSNIIQREFIGREGTRNYFLIPNVTYRYSNFSETVFPKKGMNFETRLGGIDDLKQLHLTGFAKINAAFYNALLSNERLVLKTQAQSHLTVGDLPQFYQSPNLGADTGLRGYRNNRFTGGQSLSGGADLAYNFQKIRTFFFPLNLQVYAGYDIGRVWLDEQDSSVWHDSYGGGFAFQWTQAIRGGGSVFRSGEDTRIEFSFRLVY
ncbi:MAG: phosphoesterase [Flavobacteriaceae bacterium]|nr:phosphoesterase [Flavobacteriaceae bacterium]